MPALKHLVWPDLARDCGCDQPVTFPPVALPDPAALGKSVASDGAGLLRQFAALAAWVGDAGRPVDERGEARKGERGGLHVALCLPADVGLRSDAPVVTRLWRLAVEFDIIQVRRTRVVLGAGAHLVDAALAGEGNTGPALDLWCDVADALIHPPAPATAPKGMERLHDWLKPWMPRLFGVLYAANAASGPADLDALIEQLLEEYERWLPPRDPELFASIAVTVRQALADFALHGPAVVAGASGEPDPRHFVSAALLGTAVWALHPEPGLAVSLTDLGRYLVRQRLLAENADAPLAG